MSISTPSNAASRSLCFVSESSDPDYQQSIPMFGMADHEIQTVGLVFGSIQSELQSLVSQARTSGDEMSALGQERPRGKGQSRVGFVRLRGRNNTTN